jgi:hypothetical protein
MPAVLHIVRSPSESSAAYPSGGQGNKITYDSGLSGILTASNYPIRPLQPSKINVSGQD